MPTKRDQVTRWILTRAAVILVGMTLWLGFQIFRDPPSISLSSDALFQTPWDPVSGRIVFVVTLLALSWVVMLAFRLAYRFGHSLVARHHPGESQNHSDGFRACVGVYLIALCGGIAFAVFDTLQHRSDYYQRLGAHYATIAGKSSSAVSNARFQVLARKYPRGLTTSHSRIRQPFRY